MSRIMGITTMTGASLYVDERLYNNTVKEIIALDNDIVQVTFKDTHRITYIPYHNIASWVVEEE